MEHQNFLIAGGTSGIGLALTRLLLSQGAHVTTISRSGASTAENHQHINGDLTSGDDLTSLLPEKLNGLVYCPGTINLKPFRSLSDEDFINDFQTNVVGASRLIRNSFSRLKASGRASIVMLSSVAAQTGMTFHSSISASKGALEGMGKALAAEFAPSIRVNVVAPSLTETPLTEKLINTEDKKSAASQRHPLKRIGTPEDIAQTIRFLLSDHSSWITGQVIHVDGGIGSIR